MGEKPAEYSVSAICEAPHDALSTQIDGSHYKDLKIQPIEFIYANGLDFLQGNVIKYVTRFRAKNGKRDLLKARHYIDLLLQLEYGNEC